MGKNKLSKFADMEEFPHVFQVSSHSLREGAGFEMKGKWNELFFKNNNPIVLELGCGKGEYTVGLGELYPDKNFVGVDIKGARMWKGAKDSLQKGMTNVAFLRTNIEMIFHFFAANEVSEIWITFPDPQRKAPIILKVRNVEYFTLVEPQKEDTKNTRHCQHITPAIFSKTD